MRALNLSARSCLFTNVARQAETSELLKYTVSITLILDDNISAGGGLPAWLTKQGSTSRTNATDYIDSIQHYIHQFLHITSKYQSLDGPVIGAIIFFVICEYLISNTQS
jgi:hypothetical protein